MGCFLLSQNHGQGPKLSLKLLVVSTCPEDLPEAPFLKSPNRINKRTELGNWRSPTFGKVPVNEESLFSHFSVVMESVSPSPKVSKAVSKRIVKKDWLWARETGWMQTSRSSLVQPQEWALKGYWENILRNKEYSVLSFPFPNYCKSKRREKCLFDTYISTWRNDCQSSSHWSHRVEERQLCRGEDTSFESDLRLK